MYYDVFLYLDYNQYVHEYLTFFLNMILQTDMNSREWQHFVKARERTFITVPLKQLIDVVVQGLLFENLRLYDMIYIYIYCMLG